MRKVIFALSIVSAIVFGVTAFAQDQASTQGPAWVQIEAQPTLRDAEERARAYAGAFGDVAGFRLNSGWYAIALGPYSPEDAAAQLTYLRRERLVPSDSFIADGTRYDQQFWPVGGQALAQDPVAVALPAVEPEPVPEPLPVLEPEETAAEARRSESALSAEERRALQTALQWFGHYTSAIDGAFGPGTRNSMASWQEANGHEPTGVLTTRQRADLIAAYDSAIAELGLTRVVETEAGIEIDLPLAMVAFDHYEPPFVHYEALGGSSVRVLLISEPGDQGTLHGLYDVLQTLSIVPIEGPRERRDRSFTLTGRSDTLASHTYAELSGGLIKGYMLVWNPADDARMSRVLAAMQASFRAVGDRALDPGLAPMPDDQRADLLSGLEVRRPTLSRSGFYIDAKGHVLTTTEALDRCDRITLDSEQDADILFQDAALGLAVLAPRAALAPAAVAEFLPDAPRLHADIAVAGYSYEDTLPAPTMTFGTLEDVRGLAGEPDLRRLAVATLAGDAGGPVFGGSGAVLGMLLPQTVTDGRVLPAGVNFAASAAAISARLASAGINVTTSSRQGAMTPEDLTRLGVGMTVLVSCWK